MGFSHRSLAAAALLTNWAILPLDAQVRRPPTPRTGGIVGNELVVIATDYRFEAPEQVDAGLVNIRLFNRGKEDHHVLLIKLENLDRMNQVAEQLKTNDWNVPWMHSFGGPESVAPGGSATATMVLEPGRYALVCVVASPGTHRQHFTEGMIRELSVVKPLGVVVPATLPPTEVTVKLFEWNFTVEGPLFAGRRTIRVENVGQFDHNVAFVRLLEGKTVEQAVAWAESPRGAAPYEPVGGSTRVERDRAVNITIDLMPGEYALLCTLYNPLSRKPHSGHSMVKPIRVVF
jgi:hypothetical protein